MSKTLVIIDHDEWFRNLTFQPVILNDHQVKTKEEREALTRLIITRYSNTDTLESVPTCKPECGYLSHGHNLGRICPKCNTRVETVTNKVIESQVWFKAPDGINALINPILWMILTKVMTTSKFNVLHWFCNPYHEEPPVNNKQANVHIKRLEKLGIPRGFNNFITHFDNLIPTLVSMVNRKNDKQDMSDFLLANRGRFFPQHLPMASNISFVLEDTATGTYADTAMRDAIDAVRTVTSIDMETASNIRRLEGKMASIVSDLAKYYTYMFGEPFSRKEGWIRHSLLGSRMPFSFRTVITSGGTTAIEDPETIKIPYPQAVTVFKIHILNKLVKLGYTDKSSVQYVDQHTNDYDSLLSGLLMEIFGSYKNKKGERLKGAPCLWVRYPTLSRLSIMGLFINGLTKNHSTLNIMSVTGCNGDFDGDGIVQF